MDSTVKCFILWRRVGFAALLTGGNFLKKDWKFSINTVIVMGIVVLTVGFCAYTQLKVFFQGHLLLASTIFAYFGILLQGISKFHYLRINRFDIHKVTQDLLQLHEENQGHDGRKKVLNTCVDRCLYGFTIFCFMYASVGVSFFSYPLIAWLVWGREKVLFVEIHLPFVDPTENVGYIITLCYQVLIITAAVTGTLAADAIFFSFTAHYFALVDIFSISATEFGDLLKYDGNEKYRRKIKVQLRDLFQHHQKLIKFLDIHNTMFTELCFFEVFATTLMFVTSLFVGTLKMWIPGYILGVGSIYQFLCYCTFGTLIELSNEQILESVCNIPWYHLEKSCAMDYKFMVASAQSSNGIMIGGIAPLSVATAQEVLNKMYSFYMLLRTFIEGKTFEW